LANYQTKRSSHAQYGKQLSQNSHCKYLSENITDSVNLFVTKDRVILLDSPPVLLHTKKKDNTSNLSDLNNIVTFLNVCHLIIVVWHDYLNINFLRLLHFAVLMKSSVNKKLIFEFCPKLLFLKNRATREDFSQEAQTSINNILNSFFKTSQLHIYTGPPFSCQKKQTGKIKTDQILNNFLFPEINGLISQNL